MLMFRPDITVQIELPPTQLEEALLDRNPLIAACFLHPDDPRHLEFADVRAAVFEAEEMAAVSRFGI